MQVGAPFKTERATRTGTKAVWRVKFLGPDGKTKQKEFKTRKDAVTWHDKVVRGEINTMAVVRYNGTDGEVVTFEQAGQAFLAACEDGIDGRPPMEAATTRAYEQHLRLHLKSRVGARRLVDLSDSDVKNLRTDLLDSLSRPMAKRVLGTFKRVMAHAVYERFCNIDRVPGREVTIVSDRRTVNFERVKAWERKVPTFDDAMALLRMAEQLVTTPPVHNSAKKMVSTSWQRYRAMVFLFFTSGMRASEVRGLAWKYIDWLNSSVYVCQRANRLQKIGPCKSAAAYRHIPLPPRVIELLRDWKQNAAPKSDDELVFCTDSGKPLDLSNIYEKCWLPLQVYAGVALTGANGKPKSKYGLHGLRHFYISVAIGSGTDIKTIQHDAGHANIQMTLDVYGHLLKRTDRKAEVAAAILGDLSALRTRAQEDLAKGSPDACEDDDD